MQLSITIVPDSLQEAQDIMQKLGGCVVADTPAEATPAKPAKATKAKPKKPDAVPAADSPPATEDAAPAVESVAQLQQLVGEFMQRAKDASAHVVAALAEFKAKKLSDLDVSNYAAFLEDLNRRA